MEESGIEQAGAGNSLEKVKQQLQRWRAGRKLGEHIPAPLWAAAPLCQCDLLHLSLKNQ